MRNDHIINILDGQSFDRLNENDLKLIQDHVAECGQCRQAFTAAKLSHSLLQERASVAFEPPPFFKTRVLVALRERQAANESWGFARLWRASGVLAASMLATVATLAVLTFALPETQQVSSLSNPYSAEAVLLNQQSEDEADAQVLTTIYGEEEPSR